MIILLAFMAFLMGRAVQIWQTSKIEIKQEKEEIGGMEQNKEVKIKVEISLATGLILSLLGMGWGFFWGFIYELCVWRKTLFQALVGSWPNYILFFVCLSLIAIFTVYSKHPEKLCRKKRKRRTSCDDDDELEVEDPTREELDALKTELSIKTGSLQFKSGSVYHVVYDSAVRKHKWKRLGSYEELIG